MAYAPGAKPRDTLKARLILALAEGKSYAQIAERLRTTRPTIARWKHRFLEWGIDGLKARHPGRKPQVKERARLANWLRRMSRTGKSAGRFSYRMIARTLGSSKSTVHRILRAGKLRKV